MNTTGTNYGYSFQLQHLCGMNSSKGMSHMWCPYLSFFLSTPHFLKKYNAGTINLFVPVGTFGIFEKMRWVPITKWLPWEHGVTQNGCHTWKGIKSDRTSKSCVCALPISCPINAEKCIYISQCFTCSQRALCTSLLFRMHDRMGLQSWYPETWGHV